MCCDRKAVIKAAGKMPVLSRPIQVTTPDRHIMVVKLNCKYKVLHLSRRDKLPAWNG